MSILNFSKPACDWTNGLPLANGISAVMVWGEPLKAILSLNHVDFWRNYAATSVEDYSRHVRQAQRMIVLEGKAQEANDLFYAKTSVTNLPRHSRNFSSLTTGYTNSFQPIGNVVIELDGSEYTGYSRRFDLSGGIAAVEYAIQGNAINQEYFAPLAGDIIVARIKAQSPVSGRISFERPRQEEYSWTAVAQGNSIQVEGAFSEGVNSAVLALADLPDKAGRVEPDADGTSLRFYDVTEWLLYIAVDAGKGKADTTEVCRNKVADALGIGIDRIRAEHLREHEKMFGRVTLSLKDPWKSSSGGNSIYDTTDLVDRAVKGHYANELAEIQFQIARYLMMSCNRAGRRPANLQGIWNDSLFPEFDCNWHFVANVQMCHFLVNVTNLDECNNALFAQIERLADAGRELARKITGSDGVLFTWAAGGDTMSWGQTGYGGLWTGAAAWLARHFWQHYEFTGDADFLRDRAYPFMKQVGLFYKDWLIKDDNGHYQAGPSVSLERPTSNNLWMNAHCTLDTALIKDTMKHLLQAGKILESDQELWPTWQDLHDNVLAYPISNDGMLKEWPPPLEEYSPHHGIYAYFYPVYPGDEFTPESEPDLFAATQKALRLREQSDTIANYGHTYPYVACIHARFGEGDKALLDLHNMARSVTFNNLLTSCNEWRNAGLTMQFGHVNVPCFFQVDAALTAGAAIAEMLLQSHRDCIRLLPALPTNWPMGRYRGLKARGAFEVDLTWRDGKAVETSIRSLKGGRCRLLCCRPWTNVKIRNDEGSVDFDVDRIGKTIAFQTKENGIYHLSFDQ